MGLVKGLVGLFFSIAVVAIVAVVYLVKFSSNSEVGGIVKNQFIKYPSFVKLINLDNPGDLRYMYFDQNGRTTAVNVYYFDSFSPNPEINNWLSAMFDKTVGSSIDYSLTRLSDPAKDSYNDSDLSDLRKKFASNTSTQYPSLNIFYVSSYLEKPGSVGLVLNRDTIYIFKKALNDLSEKTSERSKLEKSTLMHEWGHILGLEHIDDSTCIMDEKVEVVDQAVLGNFIIADYCPQELFDLRQMMTR